MCRRQRNVRSVSRSATEPRTTLVTIVAMFIPTLKLSRAVVDPALPRRT